MAVMFGVTTRKNTDWGGVLWAGCWGTEAGRVGKIEKNAKRRASY